MSKEIGVAGVIQVEVRERNVVDVIGFQAERFQRLRFAVLIAAVVYNLSESTFARLTPIWQRLAGGCHLNRKPDDLIRSAGFKIDGLETGYLKGPRPMMFIYAGSASPI